MTNSKYRCADSDESSSDSSDLDFPTIVERSAPKKSEEVKTKGEIGLDDLPPIHELKITVPKDEMMTIGRIHSVVGKLIVIHALKDLKPLDLDSVLFLSHDKPLGMVFDVFGPVAQPFYCVRFNSVDEICEKNIVVGEDVFFAPKRSDITSYVFVTELQKQKGSDALWKFNNDPPEEILKKEKRGKKGMETDMIREFPSYINQDLEIFWRNKLNLSQNVNMQNITSAYVQL